MDEWMMPKKIIILKNPDGWMDESKKKKKKLKNPDGWMDEKKLIFLAVLKDQGWSFRPRKKY